MINDYKCEICLNSSFSYLYKGIDRFYGIEGIFDLYRCNKCGLRFIFPIPEKEVLKRYYPKDYYSYSDTRRMETDRKSLKDKAFFYIKHPLNALNCIVYSKLLKQKDPVSYRRGLKVLDVGCGDGRYLLEKRRYECECFGVDIDEEALMSLREKESSIKTYCGNLWEAGLADETFDIVNLDGVLEHIIEPVKLLNEIRRVMKKEAVLRIVVPNSTSLTYSLFRRYWMGLDCPRHIYTYSAENLKRLLKDAQFKTEKCRTIENSYHFIGSMIYIFNKLFGKNHRVMDLANIWDNELVKFLFSPYAILVNSLRIGDVFEFILRKE